MNQIHNNIGIIGLGSYVPEKILTNHDLEKMVETSDEWIKERTGISERRIADENTPTSQLAYFAGKNAIEDAGLKPDEIDLIIVATLTSDMYTPSTACLVQKKLGAVNAAAFDINSACTGFMYGIVTGSQFIKTGYYKNALIIGADKLSALTDWKDRNTCVLFGDGAGAAVISTVDEGEGIIASSIGADGSIGDSLSAPSCYITESEKEKRKPENYRTIWMDGSEVFKFASRIIVSETEKILKEANLKQSDINLFIPHQANIRIIQNAAKKLKLNSENVFVNLSKYGNMSAASIPVALTEAMKEGRIKKGDIVYLVGFGGGLTWGSLLIRWSKG